MSEDIDDGVVAKLDLSILPPETIVLNGFDDAILGLTPTDCIIYGFETCVELLMRDRDIPFEDAVDCLESEFAYVKYGGDVNSPIFCKDVFFEVDV